MNEFIGIADEKLRVAQERLEAYAAGLPSGFDQQLAKICAYAIKVILADSDLIPKIPPLPFFKERYANDFKNIIESSVTGLEIKTTSEDILRISFYIYAIFQESNLRSNTMSDADQKIYAFFDDHFLEFPQDYRMRIKYLQDKFPGDILQQDAKSLLAQLNRMFQSQQEAITEPVAKIVGWDKRLTEWDNRINEIEESLKGHTEELNFVGLSKAFSQQARKKNTEKSIQAVLLILTGLVLVALPFAPLFFGDLIGIKVSWDSEAMPKLIPFAVSELIILYIFRIFLRNYMSAKTQLVQLELRRSLCAFVQTYAEFVAPLRKQGDPKVLEKFEALIFSGISTDPKNVPSQFDGLETIVQALKEIKK